MKEYTIRTVSRYLSAGTSIKIDEDEEILDSEWRGGNRIVIAILTPKTYYCGAETGEHTSCGIEVDGPDERCHHHE